MAVYAIGDVQGCLSELQQLLDKLKFDTASDQLWLVGDLVNRGPDSLGTLRLVRSLGEQCITVLGNHDLHLLALCIADSTPDISHTMQDVLDADDRDELIDWLRQQPLAHYDAALDTLMVHAGIPPQWDGLQTLQLASEVEAVVRSDEAAAFFTAMYGKEPARWDDALTGQDRVRCITNQLTRLRFCTADGTMNYDYKGPVGGEPDDVSPWFDLPDRNIGSRRIVFGHWSALGYLNRGDVIGLDTGCVWGDRLTAIQLDDPEAEAVSVPSSLPRKF